MTLKELKQKVDHYYLNERNHDLEVCIPNNKTGWLGGMPVTSVKYANKGIDWDADKFILTPEKPMIEQ